MINRVDISQELTATNLAIIYEQATSTFGTIANERHPDLSNSQFDEATLELAKKLFVLKDNKIIPRKTGLNQALDHYSQNLAEKQPLLYSICNNATQRLLEVKPYRKTPRIIICVSAYENESRINNFLTAINQQHTSKEDISVYLFLNGPNLETQEQRIRELNNLSLELDLRIIQSRIPSGFWRAGLKSIATTTALLALKHSAQADQDITVCFTDADIIGFPHQDFLNERAEKIDRGMLIDGGSYRADPYLLKEININAGLIVEIEQNNNLIKQNLATDFNQALNHNPDQTPLQYLLLGGNSACSLILLALAGGVPVHVHYFEDMALSSRTRGLLNKVFGNLNIQNLISMGLGPSRPEAQSNYVLTDGGESLRALQLNYPLANAFMAHDPAFKSQILSAIDWAQPHTLNLKRIHEEIKDMVERFLNHCRKTCHKNTNQYWSPALEAAFTKYLNQFTTKINEILKPNQLSFNINNKTEIEISLNKEKLSAKSTKELAKN